MKLVSVVTGDIVQSRAFKSTASWLKKLKAVLDGYGSSPKSWQVYRGDSFQLELADPAEALVAAIRIKASMRSLKGLDVRLSIGIGAKNYASKLVTESNGEAFVNSGDGFEALKKLRRRMIITTPWDDFNREMNIMIMLASIAMDNWTANSAEFMLLSIDNIQLSQKELGDKIGRKQSSVSEAQSRAYYSELLQLDQYYRLRITEKMKSE
ncbi:MAG TPA: hypothetical protein VLC28_06690 [Flavitalea sp.]|nr:hypothetical protein [Flavitalea sp.]